MTSLVVSNHSASLSNQRHIVCTLEIVDMHIVTANTNQYYVFKWNYIGHLHAKM